MTATRISDGRTVTEVLDLYADDPPEVVGGYVACRDPECPRWGDGQVEAFYRHFH